MSVEQKERPLVIIMQGGATRAAFGAGVLYEFARHGLYPNTIATVSAGVPTAAYYAAGQHEEMREAYTKGFANLISIKNLLVGKPVYDINYLINNIMQKRYPLSISALAKSATRLVMPIYNYHDGRVELRSNRDSNFSEQAWSLLHVSLIVHADHILHGTPYETYVDGALDPMSLFKSDFLPENARVIIIWNESDFGMHWMKYLGHKVFKLLQTRNAPPELLRIMETRERLVAEGLGAYEEFRERHKPEVIIPDKRSMFEGLDVLRGGSAHLSRLFDHGREKAHIVLSPSSVAAPSERTSVPLYAALRRARQYIS